MKKTDKIVSSILRKVRGPLGMSEGVVVETYLIGKLRRCFKKKKSERFMLSCKNYEDGKSVVWMKFKK